MTVKRSEIYINTVLRPTYNVTRDHFFKYIMEINLAHVLMLKKQKILKVEEADTILHAAYKILKQGYDKQYNSHFEDLFFMLEDELASEIGEQLVGNMHIAFSRNDMDTTMFRMYWREKVAKWIDNINKLRSVLLNLANEHKNSVMPAHTHNQQAQPTTLAHYLLAVENNLQRDVQRGVALYNRMNLCPMGAAALATTGFNIDRHDISQRLGFTGPMLNSYDAISASDFMLETSSVLSISLCTLSRFTYDLIFMSTNEVNTLRLHNKHVQTSSIMPQKRNPSALEHTRASISKAIAELQGTLFLAHSVPLGDIVDIGDDIQPKLQSGIQQTEDIILLLTEILHDCTFNEELLYERAKIGFSTVTEISDLLVRNHNVPFRTSHKIVSLFVKRLIQEEKNLLQGSAAQINQIAKEYTNLTVSFSDKEYHQATNPMDFIRVRDVLGGPAPIEIERQRQEALEDVSATASWLVTVFSNLEGYSSKLVHDAGFGINKKRTFQGEESK
ncbi:argininosuccinate lyase [Jeotgalibacillus soli]|uniref:Argininosuccinate lyase n=1 Tax=Jeotgalibacillus soli TaxID=889306 RepID=A0A0C2VMW4_9BACL|nr:argininosuccinate lyase [Jeotgalibacillus soli]KIL45791.1 argininosuccinate lyase [Jeotgalibacillus soli]